PSRILEPEPEVDQGAPVMRQSDQLRHRQSQEPSSLRPTFCGNSLRGRVAHAFDGTKHGDDYLTLSRGEWVVWMREEDAWCYGQRAGCFVVAVVAIAVVVV
ncbi:unnamed protein product, partial [Polarella glacialis]